MLPGKANESTAAEPPADAPARRWRRTARGGRRAWHRPLDCGRAPHPARAAWRRRGNAPTLSHNSWPLGRLPRPRTGIPPPHCGHVPPRRSTAAPSPANRGPRPGRRAICLPGAAVASPISAPPSRPAPQGQPQADRESKQQQPDAAEEIDIAEIHRRVWDLAHPERQESGPAEMRVTHAGESIKEGQPPLHDFTWHTAIRRGEWPLPCAACSEEITM